MERDIDNLNRKQEKLKQFLIDTQTDLQDVLDLVEQIAENSDPFVQRDCKKMVNRFNPGAYEDV